VQLALPLASVAVYHDVWTRVPDAARVPGAPPGSPERRRHDASYIDTLLVANAGAMLYTLTRLLTPVSYRRALELGRQLGLPPEEVTARLALDRAGPNERPPGGKGDVSGVGAEQAPAPDRPRDSGSPSSTAPSA